MAQISRVLHQALAEHGYRITAGTSESSEVETVFIWHDAYDAGMTALGWTIRIGKKALDWEVYVREISNSRPAHGGTRLGSTASHDQAVAAIIEWADQSRRQWQR